MMLIGSPVAQLQQGLVEDHVRLWHLVLVEQWLIGSSHDGGGGVTLLC